VDACASSAARMPAVERMCGRWRDPRAESATRLVVGDNPWWRICDSTTNWGYC
jgi:hypothetical protein